MNIDLIKQFEKSLKYYKLELKKNPNSTFYLGLVKNTEEYIKGLNIKTYPVLDRKGSEYRNELNLLFPRINNKPSNEEMVKRIEFKKRYKAGLIKANLDNGDIVKVQWRGKRGYKRKGYYVIKYLKNGELIETSDYKLIDEFFEK